MALRGKAKEEFLERMRKGRAKAKRGKNPKRKTAAKKKKPAARKTKPAKKRAPKKNGAKKKAKNLSVRKSKKTVAKGFGRQLASEHFAAKKKAGKRKRRNSGDTLEDAKRMYEDFHGRPPGSILEYEMPYHFPQNFADCGTLKELKVFLDPANPKFPITGFGECQVVCTPNGSNLYFVGGDQKLSLEDLDIASDKDDIDLGPCVYIMYHTTKGFHDFAPTDYWHLFGEEDGVYPRLCYNRLNQRLYLMGGNYTVKPAGIIN